MVANSFVLLQGIEPDHKRKMLVPTLTFFRCCWYLSQVLELSDALPCALFEKMKALPPSSRGVLGSLELKNNGGSTGSDSTSAH